MIYPFNGCQPDIHESAFVAPSAVLIGQVSIGAESSIWFHCVARADINAIAIGDRTNIQDGCLLHVTNHHPLVIGDRVTAGHGAVIHGCRVENDCLIAMGSVILDGAVVGEGSMVAAGAVVSPGTVIPPGSLVMGVPARVVRPLRDDDRERIERGWRNYVGYGRTYRALGLPAN